jgi:hypothetical protein
MVKWVEGILLIGKNIYQNTKETFVIFRRGVEKNRKQIFNQQHFRPQYKFVLDSKGTIIVEKYLSLEIL